MKTNLTIGLLAFLMMLSTACNRRERIGLQVDNYKREIEALERAIEIYNETVPFMYTQQDMREAIKQSYEVGLSTGIHANRKDPDFKYRLKELKSDELAELRLTHLKIQL